MGTSCNGCRVLRKGCSDKCPIRPCLEWIKTPHSQANATLFLAKFYGRAGLINLINAGPQNLRPAIFRSLLYEACGRIVNPIHGSVGLHGSGCWQLCQAAVEAVLNGAPITQVSTESALNSVSPSLKACDIRHVSNERSSAASDQLHKVKSRSRFKSSASKPKPKSKSQSVVQFGTGLGANGSARLGLCGYEFNHGTVSRDSGVSLGPSWERGDSGEGDSVSVETVEASLAKRDEQAEGSNVDLELTLGFGPRV